MRARWRLLWAAVMLCLAGCDAPPQHFPLRIGTGVWTGVEPLFLARDQGYLEASAVQLVEYPASVETLRAYRNQAIDGAIVTLDEALSLAAEGFSPRIVLVTDFSHGGDAILARPHLKDVKALAGQRIALESGGVSALVLRRALALSAIDPASVRIVDVPVNEQERAYREGKVDAVVTYEPMKSRLQAAGARVVFDTTRIPGEILDVLIIEAAALRSSAPQALELLRGWFRALDRIAADPVGSAGRMAVREQVDPAQFLLSMRGLRFPDYAENRSLFEGPSAPLRDVIFKTSETLRSERLIGASADVDQLIDPGPLRALAP